MTAYDQLKCEQLSCCGLNMVWTRRLTTTLSSLAAVLAFSFLVFFGRFYILPITDLKQSNENWLSFYRLCSNKTSFFVPTKKSYTYFHKKKLKRKKQQKKNTWPHVTSCCAVRWGIPEQQTWKHLVRCDLPLLFLLESRFKANHFHQRNSSWPLGTNHQ